MWLALPASAQTGRDEPNRTEAKSAGGQPERDQPEEPTAPQFDEEVVVVGSRARPLTATEYEVVRVLSVRAGRVTTPVSLLRQAWGGRTSGDGRLVRTVVKRVRRKLGDDAARPRYIFTERGVGYRMPEPGGP